MSARLIQENYVNTCVSFVVNFYYVENDYSYSQFTDWFYLSCIFFLSVVITQDAVEAYKMSRNAARPVVVLSMKELVDEGLSRGCRSEDEVCGSINARLVQFTENVVNNPETQAVLIVFEKSMQIVRLVLPLVMVNQMNECIKRMRNAGKAVYVHASYEFLSGMANWAAIAPAGVVYSEIPERMTGFHMHSPIGAAGALGKRFEYTRLVPQVFRSRHTPKKNAYENLVTDAPSDQATEYIAERLTAASDIAKGMIIEGFPSLSRTIVDRFEQEIEVSPAELLALMMLQNKSLKRLEEQLATLYGPKVSYADYISAHAKTVRKSKIALIPIHGEVGGSLDHEWVRKCIRCAELDSDVRVVVLDVNGPGGASWVSALVGEELASLKRAGKKIVASAGGLVCGSADYQIASYGDYFFASKTCLVGSIGVLIASIIGDALWEEAGEMMRLVGKSPGYGLLIRQSIKDPAARAEIQKIVERHYRDFCILVAKNRGMTLAQVMKIATGEVYRADEALRLGLIDKVGDLHDAITYARMLADDSSAVVAIYQRPFRIKGWRLLRSILFD